MKQDDIEKVRDYWERHARSDPLWAILSDPGKKKRGWSLKDFFATGVREISLLFYHLRALDIDVRGDRGLDFGCGIGRLTQAMSGYFQQVDGVDISETMIELAKKLNRFPGIVAYHQNGHEHMRLFDDGSFDFIYSNIVLQHLEPRLTRTYLAEFGRILKPDGLLVFQLPSRKITVSQEKSSAAPMPDGAYATSLSLKVAPPDCVWPAADITVAVYVQNRSSHDWVLQAGAPIRLGNHWLSPDGQRMLIQDDGRSALLSNLESGQSCLVELTFKAPSEEGEYLCEIDLVHESFSWFKDKGGQVIRFPIRVIQSTQTRAVGGAKESSISSQAEETEMDASEPIDIYKEIPEQNEVIEDFPMHGIKKELVVRLMSELRLAIIQIEPDEYGGKEWEGYRYIVRKTK